METPALTFTRSLPCSKTEDEVIRILSRQQEASTLMPTPVLPVHVLCTHRCDRRASMLGSVVGCRHVALLTGCRLLIRHPRHADGERSEGAAVAGGQPGTQRQERAGGAGAARFPVLSFTGLGKAFVCDRTWRRSAESPTSPPPHCGLPPPPLPLWCCMRQPGIPVAHWGDPPACG